jgi:hypothetical protein
VSFVGVGRGTSEKQGEDGLGSGRMSHVRCIREGKGMIEI